MPKKSTKPSAGATKAVQKAKVFDESATSLADLQSYQHKTWPTVSFVVLSPSDACVVFAPASADKHEAMEHFSQFGEVMELQSGSSTWKVFSCTPGSSALRKKLAKRCRHNGTVREQDNAVNGTNMLLIYFLLLMLPVDVIMQYTAAQRTPAELKGELDTFMAVFDEEEQKVIVLKLQNQPKLTEVFRSAMRVSRPARWSMRMVSRLSPRSACVARLRACGRRRRREAFKWQTFINFRSRRSSCRVRTSNLISVRQAAACIPHPLAAAQAMCTPVFLSRPTRIYCAHNVLLCGTVHPMYVCVQTCKTSAASSPWTGRESAR